ncbi:MAG: ABC transporter permease [Candidatus Methanoperedens sp.]|nr:ABC transporter permease [Candidatus Methanoperedens sp.]
MRKWKTIAKHEYLTNIKRKEFLFVTFGIPLFFFATMALSFLFMGVGTPEPVFKIGYIDNTGSFGNSNFTLYSDEEMARIDLLENNLTHYFIIPENYTATGRILIYSSQKNFADNFKIEDQIRTFLMANLLKNEPPEIIERINRPIISEYFTLNDKGLKNEENGISILIVPIVFSLLFTLSIFTSSGFLLQGVVEEKENRIIEVILSSVSHKELLQGKIIGLGALGLTQIVIWLLVSGSLILINPVVLSLVFSQIHISITMLILAMVYFVLGYLIFASIMAGVGAVATTSREGQQIAGIFSLAGVFPLMFAQFIISTPNEVLAKALSIFPLTSPTAMIMRLSVTDVPFLELLVSIILLAVSAYLIMELSVRIFRASLLMYGKKPTIQELIKYVREG